MAWVDILFIRGPEIIEAVEYMLGGDVELASQSLCFGRI